MTASPAPLPPHHTSADTSAPSPAPSSTPSSSQQNIVLLMVLVNAFTTPLMLSATNVALPAVARDLDMNAVALGWVPMAYLMASTMFVLIFGSVADRIGRKRVFLLGTAAVIVTSVMAALANSTAMLLTARFLQGVSAAMLYATQMAIVSSVFPPQRRGRIVGLVVSAIYVGLATGPLLGGLIIDAFGWRYAFLQQVPLALVVLALGMFKVSGDWSAEHKTPFDARGAGLYSGSILLSCVGVTLLPASTGVALLVVGSLGMGLFVRQALRTPFPIWDVRLFFANRVFTFSCAASLIMYSATYANVVLISLYLQYLQGMTASSAGLVMMVQPLCMAILSPLTGRLSDRMEPRILASAGMAMTALGLLMLSRLDSTSSMGTMVLALLMSGAGFSLFSSPNVNAIMGSVAPRQLGSASGAVATTRLLGQLTSMVLVSLMLALAMGNATITPDTYPVLERTISLSFALAAALCVPGILLSLGRGRLHGGVRSH